MRVSERAITMIKHHEGFRTRPYRCPARLWTIGVGHVLYPDQAEIPSTPEGIIRRKEYPLRPEDNRAFSVEEINELLRKDLSRFERGVSIYCPGRLSQSEFDALVSFSFNLGLGTLQRSTLRQKVNRGDYKNAAEEFLKYTKAGGIILKGLVNRRKDERELFLSS